MNETICFQTNRWLKNISIKHLWKQIWLCWIDTYLKLSDFITIDAKKQFTVKKFRQYVFNMKIIIKNVFVEAHHLIDQIERYHKPLRRIYTIITTKISDIDFEMTLQMIFKVINDSVNFNELILTLFVFDVYSCIIKMNASFFIITQCAVVMKKTMNEIKKHIVSRQIRDALNIRNDSSTILIRDFSLNSEILVFRENIENQIESWKNWYKFLKLKNETAIIKLFRKSIKFRIITIKSYHRTDITNKIIKQNNKKAKNSIDKINSEAVDQNNFEIFNEILDDQKNTPNIKSSNASNIESIVLRSIKRDRGRLRKFSIQIKLIIVLNISFFMNDLDQIFGDFFDNALNHFYFLIENSL